VRGTALGVALLLVLGACSTVDAPRTISLKIAAINDFHGNLAAPAEGLILPQGGAPAPTKAGGVAKLAGLVARLRAQSPHFVFVSAGDLVGASPLLSAAFDDEPTVEAMNAAGLDLHGVGNHEFDRGVAELRRMHAGGCPSDGCKSRRPYAGARFDFLAANVIDTATDKPIFPPYAIRSFGGVKVAFVGVTLEGTPEISSPRNVAGLEFRDEAESVNALVPELRRQGIETIVVLIHQGGIVRGNPNACDDLRGPIRAIVERLDRAVDVVLSGHTHQAYVCAVDGRLLTSAGAYGRFVTEVDLAIDSKTHDVVSARAINHVVTPDLEEHAGVAEVLARYAVLAAPLQRVVARITAPITRRVAPNGESKLGQVVADAHLSETRSAGAQIAFVNPGGIRAPLPFEGEGDVTYAQVFDVYPFDNTLVTMTLTGAQLIELLEQQWQGEFPRILQVSRGFTYAWDPGARVGSRVVRGSARLDGEPVRSDASYRVTVNSYLAAGGDNFSVLTRGADRTPSEVVSRDAIARYLGERSPVSPSDERRIVRLDRR
jgi:5'-nucleotidase